MVTETYTCPHCGATSANRNDIRERYCGRCHAFSDEDTSDESDGTVTRFRCVDCEQHVVALCLTVCRLPSRCSVCEWMVEFVPDPAERASLRSRSTNFVRDDLP